MGEVFFRFSHGIAWGILLDIWEKMGELLGFSLMVFRWFHYFIREMGNLGIAWDCSFLGLAVFQGELRYIRRVTCLEWIGEPSTHPVAVLGWTGYGMSPICTWLIMIAQSWSGKYIGKLSRNGPYSVAMFSYQRVCMYIPRASET